MVSTEDVLDKWARHLLGHTIPHTFVGFPWWVLTISVRWRIRRSVTYISCRLPLATNLGLTRLVYCLSNSPFTVPPPVRYGIDGSRRLALTLHAVRLHRTPYSIHGSLTCLAYHLHGDGCQPTFHRVTPAYSPKRLSLREWIRTTGLSDPNGVRYQAALHTEKCSW